MRLVHANLPYALHGQPNVVDSSGERLLSQVILLSDIHERMPTFHWNIPFRRSDRTI